MPGTRPARRQLAAAVNWPIRRLVAIWNQLPGVRPVARFENRRVAVRRIWQLLEEPKNVRRAPSQAWGVARRNIAIYGDKIIAATVDAHLIALDARTGKVVWDQAVANPKQGYRYSSGPIIIGKSLK